MLKTVVLSLVLAVSTLGLAACETMTSHGTGPDADPAWDRNND